MIWRGAAVLVTAIFLLGNITTTRKELQTAPYRKELCVKRAETALDFENKTDDELRAEFEFRTSWDQSGAAQRPDHSERKPLECIPSVTEEKE